MIFIGRVKITITGFMKALMILKTSATIKAVAKELTLNPGKYWETRRIVKAERIQFAKIAITKLSISLMYNRKYQPPFYSY